MVKTIDDVVNFCEEKYALKITRGNRRTYKNFLERFLEKQKYDLNFKTSNKPNAGYPYFRLTADVLLLFSYMTGKTEIEAGIVGNSCKKQIKSVEDLYLLRLAETGASGKNHIKEKRTDQRLFRLIGRINGRKHVDYIRYHIEMPGWNELIDELGKDKNVKKYFGQQITYKMVSASHSPNILRHGGYRKRKNEKPRNNTTPKFIPNVYKIGV